MPPHIYSISDTAYHDMLQHRENQSILITGESGAGKTENTKKVIQYLTSIAGDSYNAHNLGRLEQQILQANPILEAFGNAQTIRNNNSSRFGKFIRIEFNSFGSIAGANIERYLLEKSRVTYQTPQERNYHIFYQLLKGAPPAITDRLYLYGSLDDYTYTKYSRKDIDGVDDVADFHNLTTSMQIVGLDDNEQFNFFRVVAAVLHLGNIIVTANNNDEQAQIPDKSVADKVCHILGIPLTEFLKGLLTPQVKAGREWVTQARNKQQVLYTIESLAKTLYERSFGALVDRINNAIDRSSNKSTFIGVLDIAGFEIFEVNSFEQLCINYTNEKLQQFFNHHMFVLEQEEYKAQNIEWKFIDFGLDLQPTIDLIEKTKPVGILSCLDEECVMPKATDKTFIQKLDNLWRDKSTKYEAPRFQQGFILHHYAAKVEYRTGGWLNKNTDPLNENVARLLARSSETFIGSLFAEYLNDTLTAIEYTAIRRRITKKGIFRTVAQRHREQLHSLMQQLNSTQPHFVRCIVPNDAKKPFKIHVPLVLDQLRCNGVLEGIRICRSGFPNRLSFVEFRQRYDLLTPGLVSQDSADDRKTAEKLIEALHLDPIQYRIGTSKVFFRAGVLAELEELRDAKLSNIFSKLQAVCRGVLARNHYQKRTNQLESIRLIQKNVRLYLQLRQWSWWKLYSKSKPLLNVTRMDQEIKKKEDTIRQLETSLRGESENRQKMEYLVQQMKSAEEENRLRNIGDVERAQKTLQEELAETKARLEKEIRVKQEEASLRRRIEAELQELKIRCETEKVKSSKLEQSLTTYKFKADGTISKLESVELEKLKAEEYLKLHVKELEETLSDAINDRKAAEDKIRTLEEEIMEMETKMDDEAMEMADLALIKRRLQENIEEERERYKNDIEERENALEQTRKKYQKELARLASEVEMERTNTVRLRQENKELLMENEDLLAQTEEETLSMATWKRDKEKLENKVADLAQLYNDAINSYDESQAQIANLVNQARDLRAALDDSESQRMLLEKIKRNLEERIEDMSEQFHSENQNKQAAERNISALDSEVNELRQLLEEQQDNAITMTEKLRKSELTASEAQTELSKEREENQDLIKIKIALEKQIKELNLRIVDLETKSMSSPRGLKRLESRLEEVTLQLETETREKNEALRQSRKNDRTIRELQYQLAERDKLKSRSEEEFGKFEQKITRMRQTIEDLQNSESSLQLSKRRAEREANEARERSLRLERELEKFKARLDRTTLYTVETM